MNLCGGEVDKQVIYDDFSSRNIIDSPICCVKASSEDQQEVRPGDLCLDGSQQDVEMTPPQSGRVPIVVGSESLSTYDRSAFARTPEKGKQTKPVRRALDSIVESLDTVTLASTQIPESRGELPSTRVSLRPKPETTPPMREFMTPDRGTAKYSASPSPNLLNPLPPSPDVRSSSRILCPTLERPDPNTPVEQLFKRLEEGFRVRLVAGPGSKGWTGQFLHLFLHQDRCRLCVQSHIETSEEKKEDEHLCLQFLLHNIHKLEVKSGYSSRPRRTFTVVVKQDTILTNYDFEARSTLEREVVVSTVMILLDQAFNSTLPMRLGGYMDERPQLIDVNDYIPPGCESGTQDQPILCSPSLNDEVNLHLSPHRRTQIMYQEDGTETSLALQMGHSLSGSMDKSLPPMPLPKDSTESETAIQSKLGHRSVSSQQLITGNWCADDVCSLALKDIADTCTGIFDAKQPDCLPLVGSAAHDQRVVVEEYIATALGAPTDVYSFLMDANVWNVETDPSSHTSAQGRRVENRAQLLNAQALRLRNLRNEMTFAAALKQSQNTMHYIQTTQSFDDAKYLKTVATTAADQLHSSPLLQHIMDTMLLSDVEEKQDTPDVVYYDSDPEDMKPRQLQNRGPRRVTAEFEKELESVPHCKSTEQMSSLNKIPLSKKVRKLDEDAIVEIVQTMTNERMLLLWHPNQNSNENKAPICVKAWIEMGVYLADGTFLLPKLTWIRAAEDKSSEADRKYQKQNQSLKKFDLLDVCRINSLTSVDRARNPFVSVAKSFVIETGAETFVMEAQSTEDRDRIVYGLKLVIARLASLLMLRDIRAADEFFGAMNASVPGEAPQWAKSEKVTDVKSMPLSSGRK